MSHPVLNLDDYRAIRDYLTQRHWAYVERVGADGAGFFACRACGGTGAWGTAIVHRARQTDRGPVRCVVERAREALPVIAAWVMEMEGRSGDSPVIGGEGA